MQTIWRLIDAAVYLTLLAVIWALTHNGWAVAAGAGIVVWGWIDNSVRARFSKVEKVKN